MANFDSDSVTSFSIGSNGGLFGDREVAAGSRPISIAVDPTGRFAYVANASSGISTFAISPGNGELTEVGTELAVGGGPSSIAVDPTGRFVYLTNFNSVRTFAIDPDTGTLSAVGSGVATGTEAISITVTDALE